jgi:hypothetical protein
MKKFVIKNNRYSFYGKNIYQMYEVEAENCADAIKKLRDEKPDCVIYGVKPLGSIRWRCDPSLIS